MPATNTTNIKLPVEIAKDLVSKVADTSVIQTLSVSSPAIFANRASILFTQDPEAEIVGESAQHSSQTVGLKPVDHTIKKLSVTVRFSNEVQWADEDSQLQIVDAIVDKSAAALGRGLDYLVFHALNPATGMPATGLTALTAGATAVTATTDPAADLDALADAVDPGYSISGIGLSKAYASSLRKGIKYYDIALRIYMGAVLKRAHKWGFFGKPETEVGTGKWNDLSGLLLPESEEMRLIRDIKDGTLETIQDVIERFTEINENYRVYQWAWTYRMILEYYGIKEITAEDDERIKKDYVEARRAWIAEIRKDAQKEFDMGDVEPEVFESFVNSLDHEIDFEN